MTKIYIYLILFSSFLFSDNLYLYKLYNNEYEAVFPSKPQKKISRGGLTYYLSKDTQKGITFVANRNYFPKGLTYQSIKKLGKKYLDDSFKGMINDTMSNVLEYESKTFPNYYIATFKAEMITRDIVRYGVLINRGNYIYFWDIHSSNPDYDNYAREIRNGYKNYFLIKD